MKTKFVKADVITETAIHNVHCRFVPEGSKQELEFIEVDDILAVCEGLKKELCCEKDCDEKYKCMNCKLFDGAVEEIRK